MSPIIIFFFLPMRTLCMDGSSRVCTGCLQVLISSTSLTLHHTALYHTLPRSEGCFTKNTHLGCYKSCEGVNGSISWPSKNRAEQNDAVLASHTGLPTSGRKAKSSHRFVVHTSIRSSRQLSIVVLVTHWEQWQLNWRRAIAPKARSGGVV